MLAVVNAGSYEGLETNLGHPAHFHRPLMQVPVLGAPRNIDRLQKIALVCITMVRDIFVVYRVHQFLSEV